MVMSIDSFGVTNLFKACSYLAEQTISCKFIFTKKVRHNFIKNHEIPCKAFIHGVYKEVEKCVLSGMQVNFSICSG